MNFESPSSLLLLSLLLSIFITIILIIYLIQRKSDSQPRLPSSKETNKAKTNKPYNHNYNYNYNPQFEPQPTIKGREKYRVMVDLHPLDQTNWLTIDKRYMDEHNVRKQLLDDPEKKEQVLQCLPGSFDACVETLEEVVKFLCYRYPEIFSFSALGLLPQGQGQELQESSTIYNRLTGEKFVFYGHPYGNGGGGGFYSPHNQLHNIAHYQYGHDNFKGEREVEGKGDGIRDLHPLEIAVRLTMEDLSILAKNENGEYYL